MENVKMFKKHKQTSLRRWRLLRKCVVAGLSLLILLLALSGCAQTGNGLKNAQHAQNGQSDSSGTAPIDAQSNNGSSQAKDTSEISGNGSSTLPPDSMISASQLDQGIKAHQVWQIIDVRELSEFATGHVPGAVNIPLGKLEADLSKISKDKDIILVDLNGTRSFTAWQELQKQGYDPHRLKVLVGGMEQWKSLGSGEITESIGGC
ncbi:MAG: rhodanese-like domain-containing protein [Desulfitobacteriaceae bacterium]